MRKSLLSFFIVTLVISLIFNYESLYSQTSKRVYKTKNISTPPLLDGKLNDDCWIDANWQNDFIQYQPAEGKEASQKTEFAILFDEHNIYIAAKCFDTKPDSIEKRITRRDNLEGDGFIVQIDSYFDKRTAFAFCVSASGVKKDQFVSTNGEDNSWDAVWYAKTSSDEKGWYAEMKIPLTQLRYEGGNDPKWGIQVGRIVFRNQETTIWQPASRKNNGWVAQYGELTGMNNLKSRKIFEIVPYSVARYDTYEKDAENPFMSSGNKSALTLGIDGKAGITNNLTLDFTVNPDFGQVEADPSEVNLSSFETFFSEKRPFFVEGKNIFSFQMALGDGDVGNENLFYSRRIGRRPHYSPSLEDNEYAYIPEFTRIIGAAKLSGKTKDGWSIGVLESMTSSEFAKISGNGQRKEMTEPLTNFAVARFSKDMNKGNTVIGGMLTAVHRNLKEEQLDFLHKAAYTGGIDLSHQWHNKDWQLDINTYFSRVEGSNEAMIATQRASTHNFQRSDATHLQVDSLKTSLNGTGGKVQIGKMGGQFRYMFATMWKSPQLEVNDAGFMRISDDILQIAWANYRILKPTSIFRTFNVNFNQHTEWNFAGDKTGIGGNMSLNMQFKNYWFVAAGFNVNGNSLSTTSLRGGPAIKNPGSGSFFVFLESNEQKKFVVNASFNAGMSLIRENYEGISYDGGFDYKPTKSLQLSVQAGFTHDQREMQYISEEEYNNQKDYLFGRINQRTFSGNIRINYNITPDLSIQYWGQPFISAGKYTSIKKTTDTRAAEYHDRFRVFTQQELSYNSEDNTYTVSSNIGNELYTFDNPDFNVKEFLSNMVLRWEYKPGSTLYMVWSQKRDKYDNEGGFGLSDNMNQLFSKKPYNIFLLKFSYRFGR